MMVQKKYILTAAVIYLAIGMPAQATTFVEVVEMASDHPAIRASRANSAAASADIDQARSTNNLKVSAGVSATKYSGQDADNNLLSPHIDASKVLYDHGRQQASVDSKEAAFFEQQAEVRVEQESINKQVLSLYSSLWLDTAVIAVLEKQIASLKDLENKVQNIAQIDSGRASEVNQVDSRLAAVIANYKARKTSQQQSLQQISQMLNQHITLTNELPDLIASGLLSDNMLAQANRLLSTNPSVVAARFKQAEAEANVRLASKWNRPRWTVQMNLNSPRRNNETKLFKEMTLQVSSDIDILDGGAGAAAVKGETQRLAAAGLELEAAQRSAKQDFEQLWVSLPLRRAQIEALRQQVQVADDTWKAGETQFFAGRRPLTDLISFSSDYYASQVSYEESRIQYIASQWQILSALGKITETVERNRGLRGEKLPAEMIAQAASADDRYSAVDSVSPQVESWQRRVDSSLNQRVK